ncbi:MAG TPA: diguanylate cyclase, partial [Firmicutes bacterium]|nr:diguanylate cyclase [Bacillota bacterium]
NLERNESLVRILQYPAASIQELIDYALQESINLTDSQIGYIYFYDEKKKQFTLNTWSKEVMPQCTIQDKQTVYQLDKTGIWGEAVRQRKPLIVNDFNKEHPLKKGYPEGHVPLQKYMTVPIFDGEEIVAVIGLANKKEDYDEMDIWQITLLMNSVWSMVERQRSKIALRDEKERLSATLLSVGDAVIATDKLGRVEIMNEVAEKLTEWDREDAVGQPFSKVFKIVNEQTGLKCPDPVEIVLASGKTVGLANHTVLLGRRGGKRHIADAATPIRDAKGEISGVVLVFRDVSQERKRLEEIRYLSNRDHLTGLYNRRYFEQKLAELDTAESLPISIIMADLDGLKIANDTFGHSLGDQILRRAAEIMKRNCRSGDIVARWGGDEFVLLLPHTNIKEAEALGLRVEGAFKNERVESVPLSISLGWAVKTDVNQEMGEIFKKAEDHMFRAKLLQSPGIRSDVIQALMTALYEKDPREEQHCQRVSKYSQLLGRTMGLNERKVRELGVTGLFHDIGKVSIPEQILNKPGRLTEEEWKEIRRHPEVGYRVLSNVKDMAEIADYVLAHHERWDGQGYPRGLLPAEVFP